MRQGEEKRDRERWYERVREIKERDILVFVIHTMTREFRDFIEGI